MASTSPAAFLRYGVWASLTGGWLFDPRRSLFCNTVHMYLWLVLFSLPMLLVTFFSLTKWSLFIYSIMVALLFTFVKSAVWALNYVFDKYDPIEEVVNSSSALTSSEEWAKQNAVDKTEGENAATHVEMELQTISKQSPVDVPMFLHSSVSVSRQKLADGAASQDIAVEADVHSNADNPSGAGVHSLHISSAANVGRRSEDNKPTNASLVLRKRACLEKRAFGGSKSDLRKSESAVDVQRPSQTRSALLNGSVYFCNGLFRNSYPGATSSTEIFLKKALMSRNDICFVDDSKRRLVASAVGRVRKSHSSSGGVASALCNLLKADVMENGKAASCHFCPTNLVNNYQPTTSSASSEEFSTSPSSTARAVSSQSLLSEFFESLRLLKTDVGFSSKRVLPRNEGSGNVDATSPSLIPKELVDSPHSRMARGLGSPALCDQGPSSSQRPTASSKSTMIDMIRKLLEEIVETHPEALQAIESVRQSKIEENNHPSGNGMDDEIAKELIDSIMGRPTNDVDPSCALSKLPVDEQGEDRKRLPAGKHVAKSYDDTSEGAVHCFQDQSGKWWAYTFSSNGTGTAQALDSEFEMKANVYQEAGTSARSHAYRQAVHRANGSSSSEESLLAGIPSSIFHPVTYLSRSEARAVLSSRGRHLGLRSRPRDSQLSRLQEYVAQHGDRQMFSSNLPSTGSAGELSSVVQTLSLANNERSSLTNVFPAPARRSVRSGLEQLRAVNNLRTLFRCKTVDFGEAKSFCYKVPLKWSLGRCDYLKIHLDRLRLSTMFDRNVHWFSAAADVLLAVSVGVIAFLLLMNCHYHDFGTLFLCFCVAGAQFSLLKSVQPDAASPIHGYNSIVPYNRPVYFCLMGAAVLIMKPLAGAVAATASQWQTTVVDAVVYTMETSQDVLLGLLLFLPLLFTLGILPQLNTFCCYLLEQVDMHLFGGTAAISLASAIYGCLRNVLCAAVLYPLGWVSLRQSNTSQSVPFSAFCGLLIFFAYMLSRCTSDPKPAWRYLWTLIRRQAAFWHPPKKFNSPTAEGGESQHVFQVRLKNSLFLATVVGLLAFALHCSTVFTSFPVIVGIVFPIVTVLVGFATHYLMPQLRKHTPCIIFSRPLLKASEYGLFDVSDMAKLMWFELMFAWSHCFERHVLYPTVVLSFVTSYGHQVVQDDGSALLNALVLTVAGLKLLRVAFSNCSVLHIPLAVSLLLTFADNAASPKSLLITMYVMSIVLPKLRELMLKLQFIFAYVAPWQISWGSAFHAFAQPCAISHSAFTLVIAAVSSLLSAPLNPFMGSSVFFMSYVRPVKFWEKNYNTKRLDHSNTRLAAQIDRGPTTDDSNLNAIFYEHLTRSLQRQLAGDLMLGRFAAELEPGDCFVLASFYLNCLIHVVEIGNGFMTFQLRGLEFRGTYCQQREVEAITEDVGDTEGCCPLTGDNCHLPGFVAFNSAWNMRWLAWEIRTARYILDGYSVTDNSAISLFQLIELRKLLVTLYVKCIVYYALRSSKLIEWLQMESVVNAIAAVTRTPDYVDVDTTFCIQNDEDYDLRRNGVSLDSFQLVHSSWIAYCLGRAERKMAKACAALAGRLPLPSKSVVVFCYLLSLFGRRLLGVASQSHHTTNAESFLYGLHALFKGDFRITCSRDEWVFSDMEILSAVIGPAVRMAVKLHQDHFTFAEDFDDNDCLYALINGEGSSLFISHENDPAWREAVLSNTSKLLALRHVSEDGLDDFKVIMLNKRYVSFRVIKLNRECVRAFWASQQQELIFIRNRNPERGSIQNARQVLRNIINSSADQPIGYPIYVSPLTTSYCETHPQLNRVLGPTNLLQVIGEKLRLAWHFLQLNCGMRGSGAISVVDQCARSAGQPLVNLEMQPVKTVPIVALRSSSAALQRSNLSLPTLDDSRAEHQQLQRSSTHPIYPSLSDAQQLTNSSRQRRCTLVSDVQNVSNVNRSQAVVHFLPGHHRLTY